MEPPATKGSHVISSFFSIVAALVAWDINMQAEDALCEAEYELLAMLILPHKAAIVRRVRKTHDTLRLPDFMRITSNVQDGMYDEVCVLGTTMCLAFAILLVLSLIGDVALHAVLAFLFFGLVSFWLLGRTFRYFHEKRFGLGRGAGEGVPEAVERLHVD
ncbi:hypothetical protein CkaCkLH20_06612 [Colletotrichum karsti]|uniref:Uncharacterized protein n=1 Tax=Colletotrichum karsti TaxID=1095194 RepID=A0A9P6IBN6_9PEZI|nr:uncharacterized protein CkaCkLH20_06612 [Colletotrichum karsti]KAF9875680.1 hypothetical protein CkaCkLH20_06612 [Colletotrichum karsti]